MMGVNHFTAAGMVGLVTSQVVSVAPETQLLWVLGWGASGLLADLDTDKSQAGHALGPVTGLLTAGVSAVAGGHRKGTHDIVLGTIAFAFVGVVGLIHPMVAAILVGLMTAVALKGLNSVGVGYTAPLTSAALSFGAGFLQYRHPMPLGWLPVVLAGGTIVHILCDSLTTEGAPIPVLWLKGDKRRWGLRLFPTGKAVEMFLVTPLLSIMFVWLACRTFPDLHHLLSSLRHTLMEPAAMLRHRTGGR